MDSLPRQSFHVEDATNKETQDMFDTLFYMTRKWKSAADIDVAEKEIFTKMLENALDLTGRFLLEHAQKNGSGELTFRITEHDLELDNLLVELLANAERFGDKNVLKMIDAKYSDLESKGLGQYQAAIRKAANNNQVRN